MNPLQYINKIFCTLLFFSTGNKSYSQREIHPLEPMFTYDYALKYYGNVGVIDLIDKNFGAKFCSIENFKAPVGLKRIELSDDEHFMSLALSTKRMKLHKIIYYYNSDTGFLEKRVKERPKLNNEEDAVTEYLYTFKNNQIIIRTSQNEEYTFDEKTGNLLQLITSQNDTIDFLYSIENIHHVLEVNSSNSSKKFVYKNKEVLQENTFEFFAEKHYYVPDKRNLLTDKVIIANQTDLKFEGVPTPYSVYIISNDYYIEVSTLFVPRRTIGLLFDDTKKLIAYHINEEPPAYGLTDKPNSLFSKSMSDYYAKLRKRSKPNYSITFKKLDKKKWGQYLYDYNHKRLRYKKQNQGYFTIENDKIYFKNIPLIVYDY